MRKERRISSEIGWCEGIDFLLNCLKLFNKFYLYSECILNVRISLSLAFRKTDVNLCENSGPRLISVRWIKTWFECEKNCVKLNHCIVFKM